MRKAKVFQNGRSQAIGRPKEFRASAEEVLIKKTDMGFQVITRDPWKIFDEGVAEIYDDFFDYERSEPPLQSRDG
jgi:virulence-associated protein VagC